MRAVVQRVSSASVTVAGSVVAEMGKGLCVLVGVAMEDSEADAVALADKLTGLRVFPDQDDKMNLSVGEAGGRVLVVSQFTLLAQVRKGRRPSFTPAAPPEIAAPLVERVCRRLEEHGIAVGRGVFGARMEVALVNSGPVTLVLEVTDGVVL